MKTIHSSTEAITEEIPMIDEAESRELNDLISTIADLINAGLSGNIQKRPQEIADFLLSVEKPLRIRRYDAGFDSPIGTLGLPVRLVNALKAASICNIADLVLKMEIDILKTPDIGRKNLEMIQKALKNHGLILGMTFIR